MNKISQKIYKWQINAWKKCSVSQENANENDNVYYYRQMNDYNKTSDDSKHC